MIKQLLIFVFSFTLTNPLWAADNTVVVTTGSGLTLRSRDVGLGVQSIQQILGDTAGAALATAPGAANAAFALPIQGVTGGIAVPISGAITITSGTITTVSTVTAVTSLTNALPAGTNKIGTFDPATIATWGLAATTQNVVAPTNGIVVLGQFTTTPTTITSTNVSPLQMDNAGNLLVNIKAGSSSGAVAQGSTTSGQTGSLIQGAVTTASPSYTTAQTSPLSLDTTGALRVNVTAGGAGGGIVTQATASNLNATVVGTGTFATQSTLAAETTKVIGTIRLQGNVGGVLDAIGQNVAAPANWLQAGCQFQTTPTTITATNGSPCQMDNAGNILVNVKTATGLAAGSTTSGQTGSMIMGAVTTASPSYTTAQTNYLSLDTSGSLRVAIVSGAGSGGTAIADGATFTEATTSFTPVGGEYVAGGGASCTTGKGCTLQMTIDRMAYTNLGKVNAVAVLTGTGAVGTGAQRIAVGTDTATIAGSAPGTAGTASSNVVTIQGIATMTKLLVTPDSVALPANQSVNVAQFGGVSTSTGQVAVSVAPVTASNTALVVDLRPDSPGIIALGQTTKSASVPVAIASDQMGANTAANSLPITVGPALLGSYCMGANTGTMAAGLAGGAPIYSFRYGGANLAIVRKVSVEADDITTAFVAGAAKLDLIVARSFSASDTGGTAATLTGNNGKLRTSFATTAISDLRISSTATLTAGTRTLDAQPLATVEFGVSTSVDAGLLPTTDLIRQNIGESPLVLANNEGFVIQATVPGTGTWEFSTRTCWDEVTAF